MDETPPQLVTVFGAAGPTGLALCLTALAAGHEVRAVSRRDDPLPLPASGRWTQVRADAATGEGVAEAVSGVDAVLSVLGCAYTRDPVTIYSQGTRHLVEGIRTGARGRRLVVVSSGLTYDPPSHGLVADHVMFPLLRHVLGRTLYADMRRMEELVRGCDDLDWTIMRPGRLTHGAPTQYRLDLEAPTRGTTSRADLAAAMVAELGAERHVHRAVAPTTR